MLTLQKIVARIRGADAPDYPENRETEQLHQSSFGDLIYSPGLPQRAELVRLGNSWQLWGNAATGLTAVPTTAGLTTIWNGEQGGANFLVIDSITATKVIVDVTTNDLATVWAQIIRPPMAAPTDANLLLRSLNGRYGYGGRARTVSASTTLANRWEPIGVIPNATAAIAGGVWSQADFDVLGRFIVPPGAGFTLTASEVTATASTFRFCIRWHEIRMPLVS